MSLRAFELRELIAEGERSGKPYLEFLRVDNLRAGLCRLSVGNLDPQLPHTEDEVYYVCAGHARNRVGEEDRAVGAGSVVYVAKKVDHKFHSIEENLSVLVFFAPAEYSNRPPA